MKEAPHNSLTGSFEQQADTSLGDTKSEVVVAPLPVTANPSHKGLLQGLAALEEAAPGASYFAVAVTAAAAGFALGFICFGSGGSRGYR